MKSRDFTQRVCKIRVFSNWTMFIDDIAVQVNGLKARALITMLILGAPKLLSRKEIADTLWPASSPDKARASLRQTISEIKRAMTQSKLGTEFLEGSELGGGIWKVETEIDAIDEATTSSDEIARIVQLVSKENQILASLDAISEVFDDWLIGVRMRIGDTIQRKLSSIYTSPNVSAGISIIAADAALDFDFVDLLDEELGAEPSIKTQDLAVEIKLSSEPRAGPQSSSRVAPRIGEEPLSLAVLPFEALGSDPMDRFVTLGILDQVTCLLATHKVPAVISSNSTRIYMNKDIPIRDVGAELGVTYVVTGSTRSIGNAVSIAVQLCDARTEHVIWSWIRTCNRNELIEINSVIAQQISTALHPSINAAELTRTWNTKDVDLEPYHLLLRAKDRMFRLTYKGFSEAGELLTQAIEKGPNFAPAHALLADWYSIRFWQKWSNEPDLDFDRMNEHVQRAMSLAPGDGRIMAMWGHFKVVLERNYDSAIELFSEAIELFPNDAETLNWSVPTLAYSGHAAHAVENAQKALRLSPHDPFLFRSEHFLSIAYYALGDFDKAAQYGLSSFKRVPTYTSNLRTTIASLVAAEREAELSGLLAAHLVAEPEFSVKAFVPNHGFRDYADKALYGERLLAAGLAP